MELLAILIGVRAINFVEKELNWLNQLKHPKFVFNQVREIRNSPEISFRYIRTELIQPIYQLVGGPLLS